MSGSQVSTSGLQDLLGDLQKAMEDFPQDRRNFVERMAEVAKADVDRAIGTVQINDSNGNVKRWQIKKVGTGGGYAVVKAIGSKDGADTGPNSPGAITNYLNKGHKIRSPRGGKGYRPRIRVARVPAYPFYDEANTRFEAKFISEGNKLLEEIGKKASGER